MLFTLFWVGLFSCFSLYIYNFLVLLDFNKSSIYRIRPGKCRRLEGIEYGSEDFAVVEELDLAFITSGMYYVQERPPEAKGKIFLYNFTENDPIELQIRGMPHREKFHPHGISHWVTGNKITLYVISHEPPNFTHTIEVFQVDLAKKQLIFVKSIRDEKFVRPNTIVAVGDQQLIIANDGLAQSQLGMFWEFISFKKAGSLVYFNGKESFWLAEGMSSTTAVATDRKRKHLIVGLVNEKALRVFEFAEDFHKIIEVSRIELKTAPDNLYVDLEDVIWLGAHPVVNSLILHVGEADNLKSYAPSQVLRVKFIDDWKSAEIWQIFSDDGQFISASSSAAYHKKSKKLLIGSMARQAVMACDEPLSAHETPMSVCPVPPAQNKEEFYDLIRKAREKIKSSGHYDADSPNSPPQDLGDLLKKARKEQLADENELMHEEQMTQKNPIKRRITADHIQPHLKKMRSLYQFLLTSVSGSPDNDSKKAFMASGLALAYAYKNMIKEVGINSDDDAAINDLLHKISHI